MNIEEDKKNKEKIDPDVFNDMTKQIVMAERDNMKKYNRTKSDMVRLISEIIEQTLNKKGNTNAN